MITAVLLGAAMMLFLAFFGLGALLGGSPVLPRLFFALLTAVAVAMPLVGIRALFGSHPYSLMSLTALGLLFFMGGLVAESLGGAPLTTIAIGPAMLVLGVAAFGWWKWATKSRHIDWHVGD